MNDPAQYLHDAAAELREIGDRLRQDDWYLNDPDPRQLRRDIIRIIEIVTRVWVGGSDGSA